MASYTSPIRSSVADVVSDLATAISGATSVEGTQIIQIGSGAWIGYALYTA
jgi:hypothetical protein